MELFMGQALDKEVFMKYSLVNGQRSEAQPGLTGECPVCGRPTIAKCGKVKIWHWSHKGKVICDPWWENETEWHRAWKNGFPKDWQEIIHQDKNGEKHIADVKTTQDWVIEFQHSYLNPEERKSRNKFYGKIVWVVDGTRRKRDKPQFIKMLNNSTPINQYVREVYLNDSAMLKEWSGIHAPVFFDFGEEVLWCLVPHGQSTMGYIFPLPNRDFLELHNKAQDQPSFEILLAQLNELAKLASERVLIQAKPRDRGVPLTTLNQNLMRNGRYRSRRR